MSSKPLNPHPQDAAPGHNPSASAGGLQRTAAGHRQAEHHLIEQGYVPVRQLTGKVVGIWGDAHIRLLDGEVRPLHVGDVVRKGEVVLTAQDGIVQIEAGHQLAAAAPADDVDALISKVDNGDIDVKPAAGPTGGAAPGSLEEGLRVGRDAESVTPATLGFGPLPAAESPTVQPVTPQLQQAQAAPVATPDTENTAANTPVTFDPRANDSSATAITIVAVAGQHIDAHTPVVLPQGTVSMNPDGSLTFTPNPGTSGAITFTYTDQNTGGGTATSTVTVDVAPRVDHAPAAVGDTFAVAEDSSVAGTLATNDTPSADGGNVWSLATGPAHGAVTVHADGTFSYVPAAHYSGPDSFTYTITDADGSTSTATVTLNVVPVPAARPDTFTASENTPLSGSLGGNDTASTDGSSAWTLAGAPAHGTVVVHPDGTFTYTPTAGYTGPDTFTYTITDGAGSSSTATVTIGVLPIAPVAAPDTVAAHENTPVGGTLAGNALSHRGRIAARIAGGLTALAGLWLVAGA